MRYYTSRPEEQKGEKSKRRDPAQSEDDRTKRRDPESTRAKLPTDTGHDRQRSSSPLPDFADELALLPDDLVDDDHHHLDDNDHLDDQPDDEDIDAGWFFFS